MLAIKIDNIELEKKIFKYAKLKEKKVEEITIEAIKQFLDKQTKKDEIVYTKRDPMKYIHKIKYEDDGEDLSDIQPYSHIEDSAKYIHDLRRIRVK